MLLALIWALTLLAGAVIVAQAVRSVWRSARRLLAAVGRTAEAAGAVGTALEQVMDQGYPVRELPDTTIARTPVLRTVDGKRQRLAGILPAGRPTGRKR